MFHSALRFFVYPAGVDEAYPFSTGMRLPDPTYIQHTGRVYNVQETLAFKEPPLHLKTPHAAPRAVRFRRGTGAVSDGCTVVLQPCATCSMHSMFSDEGLKT
jgi:hypothetical protein